MNEKEKETERRKREREIRENKYIFQFSYHLVEMKKSVKIQISCKK